MKHISELMTNYEKEKASKTTDLKAIPTGYLELDSKIRGFKKGELILIAGRNSNGLIEFLSNLILNISKGKTSVLFNSYWRTSDEVIDDSLTTLVGIPVEKYYSEAVKLNENQNHLFLKGIEGIKQRNLSINDKGAIELHSLVSQLRKSFNSKRYDIIFLDSIDVIYLTNIYDTIEEKKIVMKTLRSLAVEFDIPIVVLSKIEDNRNRRINEQIPTYHDLKGIDVYSDRTFFVYRPEIYNLTEDEDGNSTEGMLKIIIENNGVGKRGVINLMLNILTGRITDFPSL